MQVCEERLRAAATAMQAVHPVLCALQNSNLQASHWQKLQGVLQLPNVGSANELRLPDLLGAQVADGSAALIIYIIVVMSMPYACLPTMCCSCCE